MKLDFIGYKNKNINKPLLNFILLFTLITILLAVGSLLYHNYHKDKIVEERFQYLSYIADFKMNQINQWIDEKTADLEILRAGIDVQKLNGEKNISTKFKELFEVIKLNDPFRNIILTDNNYRQLVNTAPDQENLMNADSIMILESLDTNRVLFSDASERTAAKTKMRFYLPFNINNAANSGLVLVIIFSPQNVFEQILNRHFDKSPTIESLLIKTFADSVIYLNRLRFLTEENKKELDKNKKALLQTSSIKDRKGFVEGIDYKNDKVIALIQKVPESAWFLITKIDKSEFDEPINNLAKITILSFTTAELFFALILFWIWKKNISANLIKIHKSELERTKLENRFEILVNSVKELAIYIVDKNGNVLTWNDGARNIKGFSSDEIIGKHISIFYTDEAKENDLPARLLNVAAEEGNSQDEGFRIKKDGSQFYASVYITALKDTNGIVYGFLNIIRDLTEKRKIEEEIKKSRDFYLKLLEDFPNPIWRSGTDGKYNHFNKAWLNFTGRSFEEELGDGWTSGIHPDEREKTINKYYESFNMQRGFTLEYKLKNAYNEYRWQINFGIPFYGNEGEFLGFIGSCYDIDDMKKYEKTIGTLLRISEKLYSSLEIDQILDSLVIESIKLTNAESGFACILNENRFETKRYFNIDHWERFDKYFSAGDSFIGELETVKDGIISGEYEIIACEENKPAAKKTVKQSMKIPLNGSAGELIGFLEIHNKMNNKNFDKEDINLLRSVARNASIAISKSLNYEKLKQAEIQLRNSEAELRNLTAQIQYAREAERQSIAREVHDELGQLFTGINLNISLLTEILEQNNNTSFDEILDELHSVQKYVDKGIQTVRNISGNLRSYVLDHLGLVPAIHEYCREIERISNIKCEFDSGVESVNFDDEKNITLFRIVQEAITNVIRHAEATRIKIIFEVEDNNLKISIADNGKGIEYKPDAGNMHSMGIIGMKERAIFLGGKLLIESEKEKGTKLILSIPL